MISLFKKEILKLKKLTYTDKKTVEKFLIRLEKDYRFTQYTNTHDHFCSFFVPIHFKTQEIFVGHHIKADEWIPPGGHIKEDESPFETVIREFEEELRLPLKNKKIELFDLGITLIKDKKRPCRIHYDFWYLVFTPKHEFIFDRREFYQAEWLQIDEAILRAKRKSIIDPYKHLKNYLHKL